MARVPYRELDEMTERESELIRERGNLNVYRALANAEKVFTGWMVAGDAALSSPVVSRRLREIVVLRTAYLMDCAYELGQHRDVALTAGVTRGEVDAILTDADWRTGHFDSVELTALQLTTELLSTREVAAPLIEQVHEALGSEATVELLMIIGRYAGLALMLNALDVDLDQSARLPMPSTD